MGTNKTWSLEERKRKKATVSIQCDETWNRALLEGAVQGSIQLIPKCVGISSRKKEIRARVQVLTLSFECFKRPSDYSLCLGPLSPLLSSKNRDLIRIPLVWYQKSYYVTHKDLQNLSFIHLSGPLLHSPFTLQLVASTGCACLPVYLPPVSSQK